MTPPAVKALLGEPAQVVPGQGFVQWHYGYTYREEFRLGHPIMHCLGRTATVVFRDGLVIGVSQPLNGGYTEFPEADAPAIGRPTTGASAE